jgi:hypothetical protein
LKYQRGAAILAAGIIGLASFLAVPTAAQAAGGNCSAQQEQQVRDWLPDYYRVAAKCVRLDADSKARGGLSILGPDSYSAWFTGLNRWYYSSWGDYINPSGGYIEYANV